ncbi:MAG: chemotaxis protein CheX [Candidatus Goldiibacteriota bacterium]
MDQNDVEILNSVVLEVMGGYALMFGEPAGEKEMMEAGGDYIHAAIKFTGDRKGTVGIATDMEFCLAIAANVLGTEENDTKALEHEFDAMKEFINVVCGHFLTRKYGQEPSINLLPPQITKIEKQDWQSLVKEAGQGFMVDDSPIISYADSEK